MKSKGRKRYTLLTLIKAAVTVSILEKADFRITKMIRDKEKHNLMTHVKVIY